MVEDGYIGESKIKCPKCKSNSIDVYETIEVTTLFEVTDGTMRRVPFSDEFGRFVRVDATCKKCGHSFIPRRVTQVTDLLIDGWKHG